MNDDKTVSGSCYCSLDEHLSGKKNAQMGGGKEISIYAFEWWLCYKTKKDLNRYSLQNEFT